MPRGMKFILLDTMRRCYEWSFVARVSPFNAACGCTSFPIAESVSFVNRVSPLRLCADWLR
jgi:hypothetical protein